MQYSLDNNKWASHSMVVYTLNKAAVDGYREDALLLAIINEI